MNFMEVLDPNDFYSYEGQIPLMRVVCLRMADVYFSADRHYNDCFFLYSLREGKLRKVGCAFFIEMYGENYTVFSIDGYTNKVADSPVELFLEIHPKPQE